MMIIKRSSVTLLTLVVFVGITVGATAGTKPPAKGGSPCLLQAGISGSGGQAFTLVSLKHESVGALTRILVESNSKPVYTVLYPTNRLIVVDLPGGEGSKLFPEYRVESGLVDSITVKHPKLGVTKTAEQRVITRIEISVRGEVTDRTMLDGNTLVIELEPTQPINSGSSMDSTSPVAEKAPSESAPTARTVKSRAGVSAQDQTTQPGVYVFPTPVNPERVAPLTNRLKPATLVHSVRAESAGGALRVLIETDGEADFADFTLTSPPRIVIDVKASRSEVGNKTIPVGSSMLDRIRIGQSQAQKVRVVLDTPKTSYQVTRQGSTLVVLLAGSGSAFYTPAASIQPVSNRVTPISVAHTRPITPASNINKSPQESRPATNTSNQNRITSGPQPVQSSISTKDTLVAKPGSEEKMAPTSSVKTTAAVSEPKPPPASLSPESNNGEKAVSSSSPNTPSSQTGLNRPPESSSRDDFTASRERELERTANPTELAQTSSIPKMAKEASKRPASSSGATPTTSVREVINQPVESQGAARERVVGGGAQTGAVGVTPPATGSQSGVSRPPVPAPRQRPEAALCETGFIGEPITLDLRSSADIRDVLRFISSQYNVNFIVDKSVGSIPIDVKVTDIPWNQILESLLRANRLGYVCENGGRVIRIAVVTAIEDEEKQKKNLEDAKMETLPLVTRIIHLKYARGEGTLAGAGSGTAIMGAGQGPGQGTNLLAIIRKRLSRRGNIECDSRTNSLIVTDLATNLKSIEDIIGQLDRPSPQVEIEARIVVAERTFLREIGSELAAAAFNSHRGTAAVGGTSSQSLSVLDSIAGGTSLNPRLIGPAPNGTLSAVSNTSLSLTTGLIGTSILSYALSMSESKGQIRTIAAPRVTVQDNQTAQIVNGVQIPVQSVSNYTVSTTFVRAALSLEITPQIIEETGEVQMKVIAENNTVNTLLANNIGGTPGINTQSAQSIVRVQDGGTTVMGGINIDNEGNQEERTPGVSKIPLIGNLFRFKRIKKGTQEILFFITPRIVRDEGSVIPPSLAPKQGSLEPVPGNTVTVPRVNPITMRP